MQRKIHNQTLFVAALSVYFGLLIVGAPPHVFAQQIESQANQLNPKVELNRKPLEDFAKHLKKQILLGQVNLNNSCSISVKASFADDGKLKNARITSKTGDVALSEAAVNLISAFSDSGLFIYLRDLSKLSGEITITLDADKGNFDLTNTFQLENSQQAQQIASSLNLVLSVFRNSQKNVTAVAQETLRSVEISVQDKELFIVTRLPRAGLDALFKANEKAN